MVVANVLPPGTTFASATTTQGTVKGPLAGKTGTVAATLGALPRGGRVTITLTVNVTLTAPATISNTVSVAHPGVDPGPSNNSATVATNVVGAGTFALKRPQATVRVGEHARLTLEWTVPGPSWRELRDLDLRIRDASGIVLWIQMIERDPVRLALFENGRFGKPRPIGNDKALANEFAEVFLARTSVKASGPADRSVELNLDVTFTAAAGGRTYVVEVRASDDLGNVDDWKPAGTLTVKPREGKSALTSMRTAGSARSVNVPEWIRLSRGRCGRRARADTRSRASSSARTG